MPESDTGVTVGTIRQHDFARVWIAAFSTTTRSLFQVKYSLQSLCPQLAKATRGGHKKKENSIIHIYIYIKRAILEAI